jgi:hypothetical protein
MSPRQPVGCSAKIVQTLIEAPRTYAVDLRDPVELGSNSKGVFPEEYSVGGWFKWTTVE